MIKRYWDNRQIDRRVGNSRFGVFFAHADQATTFDRCWPAPQIVEDRPGSGWFLDKFKSSFHNTLPRTAPY